VSQFVSFAGFDLDSHLRGAKMKEKEFGGILGRRDMIPKKDKADLKRTGIKEGFPHEFRF